MKGKIALVTGATKGIGKEIALTLARAGVDVIANGRNKADGDVLADELKSLGVRAEFIQTDVSNYENVKVMLDAMKEKYGRIDFLVNNAGITKDRTLKKMTKEEWNDVININLNSVFNVTQQALANEMIPDGGRIICISSVVGVGGNFGQANYAATKAGIIGFVKSISKELGKQKITVNAVAPGFIKSEMTDKIPFIVKQMVLKLIPSEQMGEPADVANVVKFLCSPDAKYISGQVIRVDGGLSI